MEINNSMVARLGNDQAVRSGVARLRVSFRARLDRSSDAAPSGDADFGFGFRVDFGFGGGSEGTGSQSVC